MWNELVYSHIVCMALLRRSTDCRPCEMITTHAHNARLYQCNMTMSVLLIVTTIFTILFVSATSSQQRQTQPDDKAFNSYLCDFCKLIVNKSQAIDQSQLVPLLEKEIHLFCNLGGILNNICDAVLDDVRRKMFFVAIYIWLYRWLIL
jgi:hypothetical protein